ncbi:hypothetical protein HK405_010587 [Cladochytrium tenue]|nr:hypothetical protein HK405_010587 [Cladochytrium tenue]
MRDREETERLIESIVHNSGTSSTEDGVAILAGSSESEPPETRSNYAKREANGQGIITQVAPDPSMAEASAIPPFSLGLLLSHMQAHRPVRKVWWEQMKLRVDLATLSNAQLGMPGTPASLAPSSPRMEDVAAVGLGHVATGDGEDSSAEAATPAADGDGTPEVAYAPTQSVPARARTRSRSDPDPNEERGRRARAAGPNIWRFLFKRNLRKALETAPDQEPGHQGSKAADRQPMTSAGSALDTTASDPVAVADHAAGKPPVGLPADASTTSVVTVVDARSSVEMDPGVVATPSLATESNVSQDGAALQAAADRNVEVNVWVRRVWLVEFVGL